MNKVVKNRSYNNSILLLNEDELKTSYKNESVYPMNNTQVDKVFYSVYELKRKFLPKEFI